MANLELVRDFYQALWDRDYEAFTGLCDPELEWIQNEGFPYGGRHHGAAAVVAGVFRTLAKHWDPWGFALQEMLDAGDSIVVLGEYTGRHKATGKSFQAATAHILDIRNGRVHRFRQYTDTALIRDATV